MKINFYPESDNPKFIAGAKEYQELWDSEGERIQEVMERLTSLRFKEKEINALVFEGISFSYPLRLRANHPSIRGVLTHELLHRLLEGNGLKTKDPVEAHTWLDLKLYEIWVELYGEDFAKKSVELEYTYHSPIYKQCWEWALALTPEARTQQFKELIEKKS